MRKGPYEVELSVFYSHWHRYRCGSALGAQQGFEQFLQYSHSGMCLKVNFLLTHVSSYS